MRSLLNLKYTLGEKYNTRYRFRRNRYIKKEVLPLKLILGKAPFHKFISTYLMLIQIHRNPHRYKRLRRQVSS